MSAALGYVNAPFDLHYSLLHRLLPHIRLLIDSALQDNTDNKRTATTDGSFKEKDHREPVI